MKLEQKDMGDDLELDMSPMIDMVFLLLIFFIVASQIVDEKPKVEIPTAAYSKIDEDQTGRLMITVQKQSDDPNDDEVNIFVGSNKTPLDIETVKDIIANELELNAELRVLIRADADVKYKQNEKITIACAEVGAQDLIYSVFEE